MRQILLFSITICISLIAAAQTPSQQQTPPLSLATPSSVGLSPERLARIDAMCIKAIADQEVPGMSVLIARHGKVAYYRQFGWADVDGQRRSADGDIYRIASMSKAITSTAIMMLWEQGLFRLDDPISDWIPAFKDPQVLTGFTYRDTSYTTRPASREITIRDLLTHQSGLGYGQIDGDERIRMIYGKAGICDLFTTESLTIEDNINRLAKLPLLHDPGAKFTYGEGLDVLGYLIEILSGQSFAEYLEEHIFEPLGMTDTQFYLDKEDVHRLVPIQYPQPDGWEHFPTTFYDPDYPIKGAKTFYSGGAGLTSTPMDYARFLQMYLNDGEYNGKRLLSRTTIELIRANQIGKIWGRNGQDHALAFALTNEDGFAEGGNQSEGSMTWGGYFNTQYSADPEEDMITIIMKQTQRTSEDNTWWRLKILASQAIDD